MLIPVRCVTCGKVLADKWRYYQERIAKLENADVKENESKNETTTQYKNMDPIIRGGILDDLQLKKICCRRHMLGHVDMVDVI